MRNVGQDSRQKPQRMHWEVRSLSFDIRFSLHFGLLSTCFEEVEEFFGLFAADFGMADESDAVGAFTVDHFGVADEGGFDNFDVTEHRVDEDVGAGTLGDQVARDFAVASVSGGTDG